MSPQIWSPGFSGFGGGITAFSRELARALRDEGAALRLLGKADSDGEWEGLPLIGGTGSTLRFAGKGITMAVIAKPDRLISTHLNFGPAVRLAARVGRCPYVLVAHGIDVHAGLSQARLKALREADSLVAVSRWTKERLLDLGGIPEERVRILANTYDHECFHIAGEPHDLRDRYRILPHEKVILTVARLDSGEGYKGYDRVLQSLPAVRNACGPVRYLIAGKGGDRLRLEAMSADLGVADAVTFAGFVPDGELADLYRLADVFAMPSTGEGFGIVFLEAMGCGTPVLGGNQDGAVDALDQGRLGLLVNPTSVDAIGAGLISLLQRKGPSAQVRKIYGREAFRQKVSKLF
jgi:glycosyltransferase involved in cell wall biosynthesis